MDKSYTLIDGNNLAYRAEAGYGKDSRESGNSGGNTLVYGFMNMLAELLNFSYGSIPVIVWDGGYDHRTRLSRRGVELGIIPDEYKGNREGSDPIKESIHDQMPDLRYILSTTNIPQIRVDGYEADDVIASYAKALAESGADVTAVTVDKDYFQILRENVSLYRRDEMFGYDSFVDKYGIEPSQWVDVGAIEGDVGDNIFGVPGVGTATAVSLVAEHGDYESVISACCRELSPIRAEFPDIDEKQGIEWLIGTKNGSKTNKYAGCYVGMPFSGVAAAIEKKSVKKVRVNTLMIAMYQNRIRLAYRLKKMIDDIELPEIDLFDRYDKNEYEAACCRFGVKSLSMYGSIFACGKI